MNLFESVKAAVTVRQAAEHYGLEVGRSWDAGHHGRGSGSSHYERFDVVMPDETETSFGRIERSNCTWDEKFQVFTLTSDVEESSTRSESISLTKLTAVWSSYKRNS